MSLAFNDTQFSLFLQFLKKEAGRNLPIRKAVTFIGKQMNSSVWVLGKELQIDGEGQVVPEDECAYMWLDDTINETLSTISLEEVLPHIVIPLDTSVLHRCISEMDVLSTKCCYYFNYIIQAGGSASDSDATQFFPFPHDVCRDSFGSA